MENLDDLNTSTMNLFLSGESIQIFIFLYFAIPGTLCRQNKKPYQTIQILGGFRLKI